MHAPMSMTIVNRILFLVRGATGIFVVHGMHEHLCTFATESAVEFWLFEILSVKVLATPRKNVCACVNITEICIANVMSSVLKVVKNSKWKRLRCFAFSMKMQAE
jgi:hypothetical protein